MRQSIIIVLWFIFGSLLLPPIWERIMSAAPEAAWRGLILAFVCISVALVLLNDWSYPQLIGNQRPIVSTVAIGISAAIIIGSAWWLFVASAAPSLRENLVHLEWRPEGNELKVAIVNDTTQALRDVWLEIADIRKRSQQGDFVEVPALHGASGFEAFTISAGIGSDVFPEVPLVLRFLSLADPFSGVAHPNGTPGIWRVVTRGQDEVLARLDIPSPGVWRVSFKGVNGLQVRDPYLYFEWLPGAVPAPWLP